MTRCVHCPLRSRVVTTARSISREVRQFTFKHLPSFAVLKISNVCVVQAYSPIGSPNSHFATQNLLELPLLVKLAEKYKKSPAQIALRWNVQQGHSVLPKSTHAKRLASNIDLFDFELSPEDLHEFNSIEQV